MQKDWLYMYIEVIGQSWELFLKFCLPCLDAASVNGLELSKEARLAGYQISGIHLSPSSQPQAYKHEVACFAVFTLGLGLLTYILMFIQHGLD